MIIVSSEFALRKMAEADFPVHWAHFRVMRFEGSSARRKTLPAPPPDGGDCQQLEMALSMIRACCRGRKILG
jgi:hypothetical protein